MLVDSSPSGLFLGTPRLFSIRASDQSLMRVLLRFEEDDEEPRLVFVAIVVSRLYMSSGRLAVGFALEDCFSKVVCCRKKACAHSLSWLQAALVG